MPIFRTIPFAIALAFSASAALAQPKPAKQHGFWGCTIWEYGVRVYSFHDCAHLGSLVNAFVETAGGRHSLTNTGASGAGHGSYMLIISGPCDCRNLVEKVRANY